MSSKIQVRFLFDFRIEMRAERMRNSRAQNDGFVAPSPPEQTGFERFQSSSGMWSKTIFLWRNPHSMLDVYVHLACEKEIYVCQ